MCAIIAKDKTFVKLKVLAYFFQNRCCFVRMQARRFKKGVLVHVHERGVSKKVYSYTYTR